MRDMVIALHELYRDGGRPGTRTISTAIRKRSDFPDTVSHEAVGSMLRGHLIRWSKVECVVRQLTEMSVTGARDGDAAARRFLPIWLRAQDHAAGGAETEPDEVMATTPPAL